MRSRVTAFANQKGGVGKTTTAVNLAAALAERGKRVLLIDLDPQANASSGLGMERTPGASLYGALLEDGTPAQDKVRHTAIRNLDIIPSEIDLAGAEVDLARKELYLHSLKFLLEPFLEKSRYDHVFLDCPPSLGILTMNALTAAHALIVPSQCEYLALEGLSVITRLVRQLRAGNANPGLELEGIVMTMFDGRTKLAMQVVEEVRKHFGCRVFDTLIPRNIRVSEAPSFGKPVVIYDRGSTGAEAYRALAREYLRRRKAASAPAQPAAHAGPRVAVPKGMSRAERLRRCYFHEELDRPGVCSRTEFPEYDPTYDELKELLHKHADLRLAWRGPLLDGEPGTSSRTEPHSDDFDREITVIRTPRGDLRASRLVSRNGGPDLQETHFLGSREDAEAFLSLPFPVIQGDVSSFAGLVREAGDRGIVEAELGMNPAGLVAELFGPEAFARMSASDRDVVHALCERQMRLVQETAKFLLARGVGPFFAMLCREYATPPLLDPADFHEFSVKYDKPILDLVHDAGGRVHIHSPGRVKAVFKGFLDMGADVLHPFEAPPAGDITAAEAKALARGRMTLEGNLQVAHMYERTGEQVREETLALIKDCFDDRRGLIVSPTASPCIRGAGRLCLAQYRAMIEAVTGKPAD